jgi:hypothetical protein
MLQCEHRGGALLSSQAMEIVEREEAEATAAAETSAAITDAGSTIYSLRARDVVACEEGGKGALKRIRVVCISDTHGKHWAMHDKVPHGDVLIHAGDFSYKMRNGDAEGKLEDFNAWLGTLPHKHKVRHLLHSCCCMLILQCCCEQARNA